MNTPLTDVEHAAHILDCERLWRAAYAEFEAHGNPSDRDEALLHLHRMNEAILGRSAAMQAQRHAEFERMLDEGCDYFQVQGARDALMQQRRVS